MSTFLVDKNFEFSYSRLVSDINNAEFYYPQYKAENLYDYFLNVIVALVSNKSLLLVDSDINESEIFDDANINVASPVDSLNFSSIESVIERIQCSKSEITIFTSGTTGQPKEVVHTIPTLTRSVKIAEHYSNQIWGFAYNPTHMAGLQVFFQAVENKCAIINIFNQSRSFVYNAIESHHITHISATPTFYRLLLPVDKVYESVIRITFGGEKSDNKLHNFITNIFPNAKINNIYASTEAGSLFFSKGENFQIPLNILDKVRVEESELLIHKSLIGKSDDFRFSDDYYHTGDLIEWVEQENRIFRFKSRKNESINVGGYKVNPSEVENVIMQIPEVLQVLVYGKENSVLGHILCAEIKVPNRLVIEEIEIRKYLSERIQDFKIPRIIKFVETFTLTRTGKMKRK